MRDFLITIIIFGSIPFILLRPHVGILMWSWVSYMNPHRMSWGFAYDLPVAMIIAATTIAAWLMSKEERSVPWDGVSAMMLMFVLWTGLSTLFSLNPESAYDKWVDFNKIILMTFVTMILMKSERRLELLVWVSALSIGYFSTKGGVFTLATGGQFRVWGPPETNIADNNALAMATLMIVPLMRHLAVITEYRSIRWGMNAACVLSLFSVVGSYSRGALVAMAAVALFWWWHSNKRLIFGAIGAVAIIAMIPMIPGQWIERMDTIRNYEEDDSAVGRLDLWVYAINVAVDRPLVGGGFGVFTKASLYDRYNPGVQVRNVHSIYFEALGTQGFVGLGIFLLLGFVGFRTCSWTVRHTKDNPAFERQHHLARMLQVSIIAYAVAGAFQNLSTYDLYYNLLAMALLCKVITMRKMGELSASGEMAQPDPSPGGGFLRPKLGISLPPLPTAAPAPAHGFKR